MNNHSELDLENRVLRQILELDLNISRKLGSLEFDNNYLKKSSKLILDVVARNVFKFKEADLHLFVDDKRRVPEIGKVKEEATLLVPIASIGYEDEEQADDEKFIRKISDIPLGPFQYITNTGKPIQLVKDESYIQNLVDRGILRSTFWKDYEHQSPDRFRNAQIPIVRYFGEPAAIEVFAMANFGLPDREIFNLGENELVPESTMSLAQMAMQKVGNIIYSFGVNQKLIDTNIELQETQSQLVKAEKEALLKQVLFGAVHDLKNLLAPVENRYLILKGELSKIEGLLKSESLTKNDLETLYKKIERSRGILETGHGQLKRARGWITSLGSIDEKKSLKNINLESLVRDSLILHSSELDGINIETNYEKINYSILGDELEISSSILPNLIKNSVEAFLTYKTENPKIKVQTRYNSNNTADLIFEDNGPGIPLDIQKKIFDPYTSTKDDNEGRKRGLGLYQVKKMMNTSGGNVEVISIPGEYTRFILNFLATAEKE